MRRRNNAAAAVGEIALILLPILLYFAALILLRSLLGRVCTDPNDAGTLASVIVMLPLAAWYGRKGSPNTRIELAILTAVLLYALYAFRHGHVPALLGYALAGPVSEEILYRGHAFEKGKKLFGARWSACFSSLLFAVAHGFGLRAVIAFPLGCLFAFLMEKTRRIEFPIALHALFNILSQLLFPAA